MPTDSLRLFGSFQFTCNGKPVILGQTRLEELVAYLAIRTGAPVARSEIAFQFWPDSSEKQALTNLRKTLLLLRRKLPDGDAYLQVERQHLCWRADAPCTVDVSRFQQMLLQSNQSEDAEAVRESLIEAIALYQGALLAGSYAEWVIPHRELLRQQFMDALSRLTDLLEQLRRYDAAARFAEQAISQDPLYEAGYLRLMRLHALQGDRARALRVYHNCATVLRREMGLDPSEEIQAAYLQLLNVDEEGESAPSTLANSIVDGMPDELIGRQSEWQTLKSSWTNLKQQAVQVTVITGEAGIGKTRLAEELLNWTDRQGMMTARARMYAAEGGLAYAPVSDWLRTPRLRNNLQHLSAPWLTEIARLIPELLEQHPDLPVPTPFTESWQRQRLYTALAHGLLSGNQPLLLVLDDLQWADAETLIWLHYLLRFADGEGVHAYPKSRLYVLCTVRDDEIDADHPLSRWLAEIRSAISTSVLALKPLGAAETVHLAEAVSGQPVTPDQTEQLLADTGGNPLFVIESMRSGDEQAVEPSIASDTGEINLPSAVLAVMQARLGHLSLQAREMASMAAVIGRAFRYELLATVSTRTEDEVVQALEELWQRRIFDETGSDAYDFSHDRLRDVAYAQLSRPRRRLLHRRVAEALQAVETRVKSELNGQIARHFEQAGLADRAVEYYLKAGDQALSDWSATQAVTLFDRAYEMASDEDGQVSALFGRASALFLQAKREDALADTAEALSLLRDPDHELRPRLLYLQADLYTADARPDEAETTVRIALETAERIDDQATVCQSLSLLGTLHSHRGELDVELTLIEKALTIARETDNHWRVARTQADLAFFHAQMGEFAKALPLVQAALDHLETTTDRGGVAFAWNILGRIYGGMGRFALAFDAFHQCQRVAEEIDLKSMSMQIPNMLGWLHRQLGDYTGALTLDVAGVEAAREANVMTPEISARLNVCHDRLMLDEPETALAELNVIEEQMANGDFGYHEWRWRIRLLHLQGLCYLRMDEMPRVLALAEEGAEMARHTSARKYIALYHELAGAALSLQGEWPKAINELEAAVRIADAIECRPIGWTARAKLSQALYAVGKRSQADFCLAEAKAMLDETADELDDESLRSIFLSAKEVAVLE